MTEPDQSPPPPDNSPASESAHCLSADSAAPGPAAGPAEPLPGGKPRRGRKPRAAQATGEKTVEDAPPATDPEPGTPPPGDKVKERKAGRRERKPGDKARGLAVSLTGVAALTGVELPAEERMAPRLSVNVPLTAMARALAQHVRPESLFLRVTNDAIVTVNEGTGKMEAMTPLRFTSWAESKVTFVKQNKDGDLVPVSISSEMAARILASDIFRSHLRPLKAVNLVRLPAWGNPERTAVRLLQPGYDEGSESFTVDTVPYRTDMNPDDARQFLLSTFCEFPFARPESEPGQPLENNRSFAVMMGAMVSVYCRQLVRGGLRPAFAIQANQAGSGKTLLVRMALAPVFGNVTVQAAPRDESELGKLLTATVADGHDYLVVDNLGGFFASAELESFLTSPRRRGRILGQSQTVDAENMLSVFITGNGLHISPDLARRCLLCDLWYAGQVSERQIEKPVEEELLASNETRAGFLAAMWALVEHWGTWKCKRSTGARLASFEGFSAIIGGIITNAFFADPIARPEVRLDETEAAWFALFRRLADDLPDGGVKEYGLDAIEEAAGELEILVTLVGEPKSVKTALGKRVKKWLGRQFTDSAGRPFEFGHRHSHVGAKYKVRNLLPEKEEAADP